MRCPILITALLILDHGAVFAQVKKQDKKEELKAKSAEAARQASELIKDQKIADAMKILDPAIKNDASNDELLTLRGQAHLKLRKIKPAFNDCDQAVRAKSDSIKAYHCRALAYAYLGDHKGALKDLGMALRLDPEYVPAYESRAGMHQGKGNLQQALDDYNVLVKLKPSEGVVFWRRATLHLSMNNNEAALSDLNESVKLEPENPAVYQDRARLHERLSQFDKAIADYSETIRLNPNAAEAYLNRGDAQVRLGKADLGQADFAKAVQMNPAYADVVTKLRGPQAESVRTATVKPAVLKPDLEQTAAAVSTDTNASKPVVGQLQTKKTVISGSGTAVASPQDTPKTEVPPTIAPDPAAAVAAAPAAPLSLEKDPLAELREMLNAANELVKAKDFHKAIETYSKALGMKPDLAGTFMDRGKLYAETKQWKNAVNDFTSALKINSKVKGAHMARCSANFQQAAYADAIADCTKVTETEMSPEAFHLRALAHLATRNTEKAIADLKLFTQVKQDAPDTYFQLGSLYKDSGNLLLALNAYTRAIQQRPGYVEAYRARAAIRQSLGDATGSQDDATKASAAKK